MTMLTTNQITLPLIATVSNGTTTTTATTTTTTIIIITNILIY